MLDGPVSVSTKGGSMKKVGKNSRKPSININKKGNMHDRFFHNLFSHLWYVQRFMQHFLTREKLKALRLSKLKSEKNQLQTRITDYIFSLPARKDESFKTDDKRDSKSRQRTTHKALVAFSPLEVFVILEHKSGFSKKVFKQVQRYFRLLQQELDSKKTSYRIMGIVFSHGRRPWPKTMGAEAAGRLPHWLSEDFTAVLEYRQWVRAGILIEVDTHSAAIQKIIHSKKCKIGGVMLLFHHIWGLQAKGLGVRVEDIYERVARILEDKGPAVTILYVKEYLSSALWGLGEKRFNVLWKQVEQKLIKNNLLKKGGNMMTLDEELLLRGKQVGMQAGMLKKQQQVIRNMLKEHLDISVIVKVTGVSAREVKRLQNGNGRLKNGRVKNGQSRNGTGKVGDSRTKRNGRL